MAPPFVAQYVVAHELAHLTVKNHSARFWRRVEELCPDYRIAHEWLKDHGSRLKL
jgi:predicted metal-dependent hydrolase